MSDSRREEGNSHVTPSRRVICSFLMKEVIHLLPSLNQRGYEVLPNKDNGSSDGVGYPSLLIRMIWAESTLCPDHRDSGRT